MDVTAMRRAAALPQQQAQELLARIPQEQSFASRVTKIMATGLVTESAEQIAPRLGVSHRTLVRRLRAEGTTFHAIRDEVRRRQAETYLQLTAMSIADIALSVGFSDETAFSRAFRRWTGHRPSHDRARK